MSECPELYELARARDLPEVHPLHAHLRQCPRCRASVRAMDVFLEPPEDDAISDADLADADARLSGFVDRTVFRGDTLPAEKRGHPPRRSSPFRNWLVAAVLFLAVGIWQIGPRLLESPGMDGNEMRGESVRISDALRPVLERSEGGRVWLQWTAIEGADDYVVILWNDSLEEQERLEPSAATRRLIDASTSWATVIARQAGREFLRSEPVRVP